MRRRAFLAACIALFTLQLHASPLAHAREAVAEEIVYFNTNSLKFHCRTCRALKTCTHCVEMPISEAKKKGVACKICGGTCAR